VSLSLPFFERLAPPAASSSSTEFVRAALPPRFAASPDIDTGEPVTPDLADTEIVQSGTEQPFPDLEPAQQNGITVTLLQKEVSVIQAAPQSEKNAAPRRDSAGKSAVRLPARVEPGSRSATVPWASPSAQRHNTSAAQRDKKRNADRSAVSKAPLSAAAQAQRAAAASTAPATVVQVTIDRIDVRAPATPAAAERAPRKRGGSAQSLSEYLRQREPSSTAGHE
jgi:hypothetical protein